MPVLVIGGTGFLGNKVVAALRAAGIETVVASRSAGTGRVALDLASVTEENLRGYELVINCADTLRAPAGSLYRAALAAGVVLLETTAEPGAITAGLALRGQPCGPGAVVLGVGIFPGLSNLLARALFDAHERTARLELAMRFSPFSAAGAGMVALIAHLMVEPAPYFVAGERRLARAFSAGPQLLVNGKHPGSLRAAIPETDLLHASTGVPDLTVSLSPTPDVLQPMLRLAARLAPPWRYARRAYLSVLRLGVTILRRGLFRRRPALVTIVASVHPANGAPPHTRTLTTRDGIAAGAYTVAAVARHLRAHQLSPGIHVIDDVIDLATLLEAVAAIPGSPQIDQGGQR